MWVPHAVEIRGQLRESALFYYMGLSNESHQVCYLLNHLACLCFGVCKSVFGYVDAESN